MLVNCPSCKEQIEIPHSTRTTTTGSCSCNATGRCNRNRRKRLPEYAVWEIHPVMGLTVL